MNTYQYYIYSHFMVFDNNQSLRFCESASAAIICKIVFLHGAKFGAKCIAEQQCAVGQLQCI